MNTLIRWIPDGAAIAARELAVAQHNGMTVAGYQEAAGSQICSDFEADGNIDTIFRFPPEVYFYQGVRDEYAETLEADRTYPAYNRRQLY